MAQMIGRTNSWLWWLAGLLCALAVGRISAGGEAAKPAQAAELMVMGKRAMPMPTEEEKAGINKLIDRYLAEQAADPPAAPADLAARLERLVKDLASGEWAVREEASRALVKFGKPALAALREAAKSSDAEVAERAKDAIAVIEGGGPLVDELRGASWNAQSIVSQRVQAAQKAAGEKAAAAAEAEKAGRKEESEKLRAEAQKAQAEVAVLAGLLKLIS